MACLHVEAAHHDSVLQRHARAQRPELLRQLERQLPAWSVGASSMRVIEIFDVSDRVFRRNLAVPIA